MIKEYAQLVIFAYGLFTFCIWPFYSYLTKEYLFDEGRVGIFVSIFGIVSTALILYPVRFYKSVYKEKKYRIQPIISFAPYIIGCLNFIVAVTLVYIADSAGGTEVIRSTGGHNTYLLTGMLFWLPLVLIFSQKTNQSKLLINQQISALISLFTFIYLGQRHNVFGIVLAILMVNEIKLKKVIAISFVLILISGWWVIYRNPMSAIQFLIKFNIENPLHAGVALFASRFSASEVIQVYIDRENYVIPNIQALLSFLCSLLEFIGLAQGCEPIQVYISKFMVNYFLHSGNNPAGVSASFYGDILIIFGIISLFIFPMMGFLIFKLFDSKKIPAHYKLSIPIHLYFLTGGLITFISMFILYLVSLLFYGMINMFLRVLIFSTLRKSKC